MFGNKNISKKRGFTPLENHKTKASSFFSFLQCKSLSAGSCDRRNFLTGFTLIELLVVISIIGLLSSVVLASLNNARAKARDTRRIQDFKQISTALYLYYDKYGTVPVYNNSNSPGSHQIKFEKMATDLVNAGFLAQIPTSPTGSTYQYYYYGGSTVGGILVTTLESIQNTTVPPYGSCRPFTNNWCSSTIASKYYCLCNVDN